MIDQLSRIVIKAFGRSIVGLLAGWLGGLLSGIVVSLLVGLLTGGDNSVVPVVTAVLVGSIGSISVGVIVAWLESLTGCASPLGLDWGLVGAISAGLVAVLGKLPLAITIVWIAMFSASAMVAARSVVALFDDTNRRFTLRSVVIYCLGILVSSGVVYFAYEVLGSMMD